ncbi:hypothetical protein O1L68_00320 [Streptomyces lydicus]|nr:hypothetical protein [Streptomyces lydicus]
MAAAPTGRNRPLVTPDPFAHRFITAADGRLVVAHRRPDTVISQDWSVQLDASGCCTDAKLVDSGQLIAALVGKFAGLVDHASQQVVFKTPPCLLGEHAIELIPGPYLVLACSLEGHTTGLRVFDACGARSERDPVQETDLPSAHALRWDEHTRSLWAIGTNRFPHVKDDIPLSAVHGVLARYPYIGKPCQPLGDPVIYPLRDSPKVPGWPGWRDGPHDLVPIPQTRTFLLSTDTDVFEFDIDKADPGYPPEQNFTPASQGALAGFRPRRKGDGLSKIKAMSVAADNSILIAQADAGDYSTYLVSYSPGSRIRSDLQLPHETYRARWFEETEGWPSAPYNGG